MSTAAIQIEPAAIYDDDLLFAVLRVTSRTLLAARKANQLRYTRKGQRVLYLGQWVLDWLNDSAVDTAPVNHRRRP